MDGDEIAATLRRYGFDPEPSLQKSEAALKELRKIPAGNPDAEMRIRWYQGLLAEKQPWAFNLGRALIAASVAVAEPKEKAHEAEPKYPRRRPRAQTMVRRTGTVVRLGERRTTHSRLSPARGFLVAMALVLLAVVMGRYFTG